MDERQLWEVERAQVIRAKQIADQERSEVRVDAAKLADSEARRDAMWDACRRTGQPVPTHGDILARARDAFGAEDAWDAKASYGSSTRPAMFVSMPDGRQVEVSARPRATAARSAREAMDAELLRQAKASSADTWMAVQVARAESRRMHREGAEVSRSAAPGPGT